MSWHNLAENPAAISALYTNVPSLSLVHIEKITFLADRVSLRIFVALPFPDLAPKRWLYQGYNTAGVELGLELLSSFQVVEHRSFDLVTIHLEKSLNSSLSFEIYHQSISIMQGNAKLLYLTMLKSKYNG